LTFFPPATKIAYAKRKGDLKWLAHAEIVYCLKAPGRPAMAENQTVIPLLVLALRVSKAQRVFLMEEDAVAVCFLKALNRSAAEAYQLAVPK